MTGSGRRLPRRALHLLTALPVIAGLGFVGSATRAVPSLGGCAVAATVHHAALVVEHGDGAAIRVCVSFSADTINGDQLLGASHVQYATADYGGSGAAVCQIEHEPAQYPSGCWSAGSRYWAMFVSRGGGGWAVSSLGVSSQTFRDGDAEGFRYEGQSDYSAPPSPAGVCPPPSTPAAATARPVPPTPRATGAGSGALAKPSASASAAAATSNGPAPPAPGSASASAGATPAVAAASSRPAPPPTRPASFSIGILAASVLAGALLLLLAVQAVRPRRPPAEGRSRP